MAFSSRPKQSRFDRICERTHLITLWGMVSREFMGKICFEPVWFDSLGAKSSCTLVKTSDVRVLIDPGVAVMHPSFPATWAKKLYWLARAELAIKRAAKRADVVVISHYRYDHFTDFDCKLLLRRIRTATSTTPNEDGPRASSTPFVASSAALSWARSCATESRGATATRSRISRMHATRISAATTGGGSSSSSSAGGGSKTGIPLAKYPSPSSRASR